MELQRREFSTAQYFIWMNAHLLLFRVLYKTPGKEPCSLSVVKRGKQTTTSYLQSLECSQFTTTCQFFEIIPLLLKLSTNNLRLNYQIRRIVFGRQNTRQDNLVFMRSCHVFDAQNTQNKIQGHCYLHCAVWQGCYIDWRIQTLTCSVEWG